MRAVEFITEVFEPGKQNWKWKFQGSQEAFADFTVGDREYQWHAFTGEANSTKWEIQFRLIRTSTDSDELDLFGQTGTGNSAQVLSTAVDITRSFLQNYGLDKVEEITFNAKEDSRINLYAKMIKRLLPTWDLSSRKSQSHGMQFTLTDPRAYDKPGNKIKQDVLENMDHSKDGQAVEELKAALTARKQQLQPATDDQVYDTIDKIMTRIAKTHGISGQKLHDMWVERYKQVPDTWIMNEDASGIDFDMQFDNDTESFATVTARAQGRTLGSVKFFMDGDTLEADMVEVDERYRGQGIAAAMYDYAKSQGYTIEKSSDLTPDGDHFWNKNRREEPVWEQGMAENFADGKNPRRKGLAKRVGVNCKQPVAKLRSIAANSAGERQRMAHWCANMKSGKKK